MRLWFAALRGTYSVSLVMIRSKDSPSAVIPTDARCMFSGESSGSGPAPPRLLFCSVARLKSIRLCVSSEAQMQGEDGGTGNGGGGGGCGAGKGGGSRGERQHGSTTGNGLTPAKRKLRPPHGVGVHVAAVVE